MINLAKFKIPSVAKSVRRFICSSRIKFRAAGFIGSGQYENNIGPVFKDQCTSGLLILKMRPLRRFRKSLINCPVALLHSLEHINHTGAKT